MGDFERDIVHCVNAFFEGHALQGFAYRLKQHKYSTQYVDVLVDSLDPRYYCAIECKSLKGKKIYFTQHFHEDKCGVHQVDAITEFLRRTGRRGYLAVEFRGGSGRKNEAYLMPWETLLTYWGSEAGISVEDFAACIPLERQSDAYVINGL
jgi:Holliday junction resolvase